MNLRNKFKIETYNIGIIKKTVEEVLTTGVQKNDIIWLKHNYRDRFFADPFLLYEDSRNYYVLCEEYSFILMKGQITILTIDKFDCELKARKCIISESWHMSYPFCYTEGDEIFIMPESGNSGKLFLYRLNMKDFLIQERKEIISETIFDATMYIDQYGKKWIYGTKSRECDDLFAYYENAKGCFEPVDNQPIIKNNKEIARSAGAFFIMKDELFRPVQDCIDRYGRQTHIMKMKKIGEEGFLGEKICTVNSDNNDPYSETLHTFNVYKNCIIVDGSADFVRFPMKIFYRAIHNIGIKVGVLS